MISLQNPLKDVYSRKKSMRQICANYKYKDLYSEKAKYSKEEQSAT